MDSYKHILLAENDEEDRALFLDAIRKVDSSIEITIAKNGMEVLDNLDPYHMMPDIIFLDVNLHLLNGLECLTEIRKISRLQHIPVVMLTNSGNLISVSISKRLGADAYITKPYDYRALCNRLMQALMQSFSHPRSKRKVPFLELQAHM